MQSYSNKRGIIISLLIALTAILAPGLGHIIGGQFRRGFIFFCLFISVFFLSLITHSMSTWFGAVITYALSILILIYIIIDGFRLNRKKDGINFKWYNKWYVYVIAAIFLCVSSNVAIHAWGYRHYRIVSNANAPVLQMDDQVLAEMHDSLKFKFSDHSSQFTANSFVLFYQPPDKITFIRRIIASSNDELMVFNGKIYLNGKPNDALQQLFPRNHLSANFLYTKINVPKNNVLVLMDNKNIITNKSFAFLPIENIEGKVTLILWSKDKNKIGKYL